MARTLSAMTTRNQQRRRRKRRSDPGRFALTLIIGAAAVLLLVGVVGFAYISAIASTIPPLSQLHPDRQATSSTIYAADGEQLGLIEADSLRVPIASSQMPEVLRQATVAIEDQRFYQTGALDLGVDPARDRRRSAQRAGPAGSLDDRDATGAQPVSG